MSRAARVGDPTAHGEPLSPGTGSRDVIIGGAPAWRADLDQHACPRVSPRGPDGAGSVMIGSATVFINGEMAVRMGDPVIERPGLAEGAVNLIMDGCRTVIIGEAGMGGIGSPFAFRLMAATESGACFT